MVNELPVVRFLGIKIIRYRIVTDSYAGFECQKWRIWFPFWVQMGSKFGVTNTHRKLEDAIKHIKNNTNCVVLSS